MQKPSFQLFVLSIGLCCLLGSFSLLAQTRYEPAVSGEVDELWRWSQFSELSNKGLRCIIETKQGHVWAGVSNGVLKYNGYDWVTSEEETGLPTVPVEQLLEATDGSIYATNAKGIYRYKGTKWESIFLAPENQSFNSKAIRELSDQSIVVGSNWGFLHFLAGNDLRIYTSPQKVAALAMAFPAAAIFTLPAEALAANGAFVEATDILQLKSGEVWLALTTKSETGRLLSTENLNTVREESPVFSVIGVEEELLGEGQRLFQASDDRVWVINSTSNKGISIYDGESWETVLLNNIFGSDEYMSDIVESSNGTIWLSSIARIFSYAPNGQWNSFKASRYPIPANRVILQRSQNDQLWVVGYKARVMRLDCSSEEWQTLKNLSFQFQVSDEEQWFLGESNEVVRRKGEEWIAFSEKEGLMDAPTRLIKTSRGQIWAAGSHRGKAATALLRGNQWTLQLHPKLSWGIDYRAVFEDRSGGLWFGGAVDAQARDGFLSGVLQLPDPEAEKLSWTHHQFRKNGLNQTNVYGIGQSPDGRIWIGGNHLLFFDGSSWNSSPDDRLRQFVNCIHSTDKLLLVGSRYYGLFVYDGTTWKNYGDAEGLSGNTIISIDALSDSVFIVATENSICKFDGRSWTTNVFPESLNMDFEGGTIFHAGEDIWVNHVPRTWKRRAYQRNVGGTEEYDFFTTRHQPLQHPPETTVDFYQDNIPPAGNGLISWQGRDYFYNSPVEHLSYSYRLDEGDWSPYTTEKQYSFTGLSTGAHSLEIRSRDLDFNVDPSPARVDFRVLAPIWKQGWFIGLILSFLLLFGFYEYRVLRKKKQLELVNVSLQAANEDLREKGGQIERQNREILTQQQHILEQSDVLAQRNKDLRERNEETGEQRDRLEEMLLKVQNLSKAKQVFFTNISHELRTPLSLILGPISHLTSSEKNRENLPEEERQPLYGIIHRNASRLLKLIDQLLEIRRIEQSTLEVNLTDVRIADFLKEIVRMFDDLSVRTGVEVCFVNNGLQDVTSLDTDKVEKIIVNLLSNAFRHTPQHQNGKIEVSLSKVSSHEADLDPSYTDYLAISVADNGTGIKPESIDYIFDQFYSSEENMSDQAGLGIGLAYTRDLVYLIQGQIDVSSEWGKGTTFTVHLPFIAPSIAPEKQESVLLPRLKVAQKESSYLLTEHRKEATVTAEPEVNSRQKLPQILVVEDNPDMLQFLENLLRDDYRVVTAVNGEEGLEVARNVPVDLIVSDVMMAKMDGLAFCEQIKTNILSSHIPVILLTARVLDASKIVGYEKGADDYITKPFDPKLLKVRIANLLQQREQLRQTLGREFLLTPATETVRSPDDEFMEELVRLMNENVSESEFNVSAMCQAMHLSHMHFIRKVKQLTGKKPAALLKSFRMKKAKDLLIEGNCSISEVAYRVGFDLPNSFSRSFRKEFSVSPSQFVQDMEKWEKELSFASLRDWK